MSNRDSSDHDHRGEAEQTPEDHPKAAFEFALGDEETYQSESGQTSISSSDDHRAVGEGDCLRYIGDYEIKSEIASGAMGVVFRGLQRSLKRDVAVKMIHPALAKSPSLRQRFRIETEAVAALDHPNIVPIYEVGEHEGQLYFSMRFLSGGNLGSGIAMDSEMSSAAKQRRVAKTVAAIARAVHHAHQRGILHRDLKPSNILLDEFGEPLISDFGLAKFADKDSGLTQTQATLGTPAYMSLEQAAGRSREISVASDVYSIGAILYELLTGKPPFTGESHLEVMKKAAEDAPVAPRTWSPEIALDLEVICLKALNKPPRLRYDSALELAEDLERWLCGDAIHARKVGAWERLKLWAQRRPGLAADWAVAALLLLVVLIGTPLGFYQVNEARKAEVIEKNRAAGLLSRSRLEEADRLIEVGESARALAYLASVVRAEPENTSVAEKLLYHLVYRNWILPAIDLAKDSEALLHSNLSPNGMFVCGLYAGGTVELHHLESGEVTSVEHSVPQANQVVLDPAGRFFLILGNSYAEVRSIPDGELIVSPVDVSSPPFERTYRHGNLVTNPKYSPGDPMSPETQAFHDPSGLYLFIRTGDSRTLLRFDTRDFSREPIRIEFPDPIVSLEFRPGETMEMAITDPAERLTLVNYRTGERLADPLPGFARATYWRTGEWLLAGGRRVSARGEGLRWQLGQSVILDSDNGKERARLAQNGTWLDGNVDQDSAPLRALMELSADDLWFGFNFENEMRRPIRSLPFDEVSPGGQRIIRMDQRRREGFQSVMELNPSLRNRDDMLELLPHREGFRLRTSGLGNRLYLDHRLQNQSQCWDAVMLQPLFEQEPRSGEQDLMSEDGRWVLRDGAGDSSVLWRAMETAAVPSVLPDLISLEEAEFVGDGGTLATIDTGGFMRVYSADDLGSLSVSHVAMIHERFSRSGSVETLALLDGMDVVAIGTGRNSVQIWDAVRFRALSDVMMLPGTLLDLKWLPDQKRLVTIFKHGDPMTAWVWDLESGDRLLGKDGRTVPPCLAVSQDGRFLILRTGDAEVRLWDVIENGWGAEPVPLGAPPPERFNRNRFLAGFSSEGNRVYVVTGSQVNVYERQGFKPIGAVEYESIEALSLLEIRFLDSGNGMMIATSDGFQTFDVVTGRARSQPIKLRNLKLVSVSPDERWLTVGMSLTESATRIELWDLREGKSVGMPVRLEGRIESIQQSLDGERALLLGDREAVLWGVRDQVVLFRHPFRNRRAGGHPSRSVGQPTAKLSPDGESLLVMHESLSRPLEVWRFPRIEGPLPDWVPELAEAVGQNRIETDGSLRLVDTLSFLDLRQKILQLKSSRSWERWGKWFVSHAERRSVSPFSEMRQSEYVKRLMETDTLAGTLEVLRRLPDYGPGFERLRGLFDANPDSSSESMSRSELLERAGDLLQAFYWLVGTEFPSTDRRLNVAERLTADTLFGEVELIRARSSRYGTERLIRDWIVGGPGIRIPAESFTGEQLARMGSLHMKRGFSKGRARGFWELGAIKLRMEVNRLKEVLADVEASFDENPPLAPPPTVIPVQNNTVPKAALQPPSTVGKSIEYTVPLEIGKNLIAIHVVNGDNTISDLIPDPPIGTMAFFLADEGGFEAATYLGQWTGSTDRKIVPGSGLILSTNIPFPLTLKGKKVEDATPPLLGAGQHVIGNRVPEPVTYEALVGRPPLVGEELYEGVPEGQGDDDFKKYRFTDGGWKPSKPTLDVGRAVWVILKAPNRTE